MTYFGSSSRKAKPSKMTGTIDLGSPSKKDKGSDSDREIKRELDYDLNRGLFDREAQDDVLRAWAAVERRRRSPVSPSCPIVTRLLVAPHSSMVPLTSGRLVPQPIGQRPVARRHVRHGRHAAPRRRPPHPDRDGERDDSPDGHGQHYRDGRDVGQERELGEQQRLDARDAASEQWRYPFLSPTPTLPHLLPLATLDLE